MTVRKKTVGLVGARGYVGRELLALIAAHPRLELAWASSRSLAGQPVPDARGKTYAALDPAAVAGRGADVCVLALPNGLAAGYVDALGDGEALIVDVSADYRFDDGWTYGLPEIYAVKRDTRRISNPGCYATAMQLAIAPIAAFVAGAPACFGVSGYSGAGTTPSEKNDTAVLADNLLPYAPAGHVHEREVARHLRMPVHFMPHVASFFRGISMTVNATLREPLTRERVVAAYAEHYDDAPLVHLSDDIPRVADNARRHHAVVGGWQLSDDGRRLVVYATLDNLLKGAATQAVQNINLACGMPELEGIADGVPVAEPSA